MSEPLEVTGKLSPTAAAARKRRRVVLVLMVFVLMGAAYLAYWFTVARFIVSTDDAYVAGNLVQVTSQVAGTALEIGADDTQSVRAGQLLVRLDRATPRAALLLDEAALAETVREVRHQFAEVEQLRASLAARQVDLSRAEADLSRRERLASSGAVASEEVEHARETLNVARTALEEARQRLTGDRALVQGTTVATHPRVASAGARLRATFLDYGRTVIPAPVTGVVAKRTVQLGQRVSPGSVLMSVVPLNEVWVEANFKEVQLSSIRPGQSVRLWADANDFEYHGTVVGFAAGTGAAFAVLPAQNATGNWIKVVQRLPVRIALNPKELLRHPLQIGLSLRVAVDIHRPRSGPQDDDADHRPAAGYRTAVFDGEERGADELIARIIADNESETPAAAPKSAPQPPLVRNGR